MRHEDRMDRLRFIAILWVMGIGVSLNLVTMVAN